MTGGPAAAGAHAHVFVADLDAPVLDDADHHHLARVLRLRPGEPVTVSDGRGRWRACVVPASAAGWPTSPALDLAGAVVQAPAPAPSLGVGFALTKGERPEWVVQKLTEVGMDRIVPVIADRSVVRWEGDRVARHTARLRAVAREAAMQSRRAWLPAVEDPVPFAALASQAGVAVADLGVSAGPSLDAPFVLVGPEGGWSERERASAGRVVSLGPTVLRAETAALAAGVLLAALRSSLVASLSGRPKP